MKNYTKVNNIMGWIAGTVASAIFIMTAESTASFWDCGEFIACAFKLEVGHPPGAPTFNLLGRIVSLFAMGDVHQVGKLVNYLSAVCSGIAVMFTFWIITWMAKKFFAGEKDEKAGAGNLIAIMGAGIVGAMSFTFCDSFWFSAVEGEVYSMAGFFTALIFWCATKWDREAEEKNKFRWIILIGFIIGLSIGVHLLNLLAIPAIGYIYYFNRHKNPTWKGIIFTTVISAIVTGLILNVIIPQIVSLFATTELVFVNNFGLPFNSGTIFFALLIVALITTGILYTTKENTSKTLKVALISMLGVLAIFIFEASSSVGSFFLRLLFTGAFAAIIFYARKQKALLNTIILTFAFLLIGYSTYMILVIRSNANTPLNENSPRDAIALLSYLNREQYGDWPVLYGQYYNAPLDRKNPYSKGSPHYTRDDKKGKYVIIDKNKGNPDNYDSRFCTVFPRMWKTEKEAHYKKWADIKGTPITVTFNGESKTIYKPTFSENLKFFFRYQIGYMYMRYFFWNFVGRQNDRQGGLGSESGGTFSDPVDGNWISGIEGIDKLLVGPIDLLPDNLKNKAQNHFYFLPLILGLIGMIFHFRKRYQDGLVVLLFFIMTGFAIILYLNQGPNEPRERDYAYAGSMMAFCLWIGIGVTGIYSMLKKFISPAIAAVIVTVGCFAAVPYVMGKEGWDDHDRSGRYTMVDLASNYLNSCAPNAILFTNGDNDTFPLWYAQEVEGIRTDVRVVNLSLLNTDWYIDAMKCKAYDSDPLPISMTREKYIGRTRDAVYIIENPGVKGYVELDTLLNFALSDNPECKYPTQAGDLDYFPTRNFRYTVDKKAVIESGTISEELAGSIVDKIEWTIKGFGVQKNNLTVLDIISHNNWKRPIYFSVTTGSDAYIGLEKYFRLEGLAYRFVPVKYESSETRTGGINTKPMYDNLMNKFKWGNMQDSTIYLDETNLRMTMNMRDIFGKLASALIDEGKKDSAIKALDKCMQMLPESSAPYNYFVLPVAEAYYKTGSVEKANKIIKRLVELYRQNLVYFSAFKGNQALQVNDKKEMAMGIMYRAANLAAAYKQDSIANNARKIFEQYYKPETQQGAANPLN